MNKRNLTFYELISEDFRVFKLVYTGSTVLNFFYSPSFKIVLIFRISQLCYKHKITRILAYFFTVLNDFLHGVWIGPGVKVGKRFFLGHPRGLVVNPNVIIGDYFSIIQQVTLGGPKTIIGDFVSINAGAKIISDPTKNQEVKIGDNCIIAAGAVVLQSMPENTVVGGVPAKVLKELPENENWISRRVKN